MAKLTIESTSKCVRLLVDDTYIPAIRSVDRMRCDEFGNFEIQVTLYVNELLLRDIDGNEKLIPSEIGNIEKL